MRKGQRDRGQLGLGLEAMPTTAPHQRRDTSRMAARMVAPSLSPKRARVLEQLRHRNLTGDDIEAITGMLHQTCGPRCLELEAFGFIVDSGTRRLTRSGCPAVIWRITAAGERALEAYLSRVGK